ncbi:MAG: hypothetical protein JWQ02_651 [Capsulimonas sp.]|jgi:hypothetical protein|nr:hypothetical protein [Capsulimonas sp.]
MDMKPYQFLCWRHRAPWRGAAALLAVGAAAFSPAYAAGHWQLTCTASAMNLGSTSQGAIYPSSADLAVSSTTGPVINGTISGSADAFAGIMGSLGAAPMGGGLAIQSNAPVTLTPFGRWVDDNGNPLPMSTVTQGFSYSGTLTVATADASASAYTVAAGSGQITSTGTVNIKAYTSMNSAGISVPQTSSNPWSSLPTNAVLQPYLYSTSPGAQAMGGIISVFSVSGVVNASATQGRARGGSWTYQSGALTYSDNNECSLGQYKESGVFPASYYIQNNGGITGDGIGYAVTMSANVNNGLAIGSGEGFILGTASSP